MPPVFFFLHDLKHSEIQLIQPHLYRIPCLSSGKRENLLEKYPDIAKLFEKQVLLDAFCMSVWRSLWRRNKSFSDVAMTECVVEALLFHWAHESWKSSFAKIYDLLLFTTELTTESKKSLMEMTPFIKEERARLHTLEVPSCNPSHDPGRPDEISLENVLEAIAVTPYLPSFSPQVKHLGGRRECHDALWLPQCGANNNDVCFGFFANSRSFIQSQKVSLSQSTRMILTHNLQGVLQKPSTVSDLSAPFLFFRGPASGSTDMSFSGW